MFFFYQKKSKDRFSIISFLFEQMIEYFFDFFLYQRYCCCSSFYLLLISLKSKWLCSFSYLPEIGRVKCIYSSTHHSLWNWIASSSFFWQMKWDIIRCDKATNSFFKLNISWPNIRKTLSQKRTFRRDKSHDMS